jgi:phosphate transport system substrate-binding protein
MTTPGVLRVALFVGILAGAAAPATAQLLVNGAGATFPYPLYSKWFDEYAKVDPQVRFNYQSIGSGGGIRQILARTVDFGASDAPVSDDLLARAPGRLLHIPAVMGAVVATYNLPGAPALRFPPEALANIFLGTITRWDEPAIRAANPDVSLPGRPIIVVHRSDGSGTTAMWVDYLAKVSPEWAQRVGRGTSVNWPVGLGAKGNEGVAGLVKRTPGTLGYVEHAYAVTNGLPAAAIHNRAGRFVRPTIESTTTAAAGVAATMPADFRVSLTDAPGEAAYPVAGFTWFLVYREQPDPAKGRALVTFLWWAIHDGQAYAPELRYAPLPAAVVTRVEVQLRDITTGGRPLLAAR